MSNGIRYNAVGLLTELGISSSLPPSKWRCQAFVYTTIIIHKTWTISSTLFHGFHYFHNKYMWYYADKEIMTAPLFRKLSTRIYTEATGITTQLHPVFCASLRVWIQPSQELILIPSRVYSCSHTTSFDAKRPSWGAKHELRKSPHCNANEYKNLHFYTNFVFLCITVWTSNVYILHLMMTTLHRNM
jgi:hypothetical protein